MKSGDTILISMQALLFRWFILEMSIVSPDFTTTHAAFDAKCSRSGGGGKQVISVHFPVAG